jgi:hypothetical protein
VKGKLHKEFVERVRTDLTDDLDRKLIVGTAEDIVRELCWEIESRLLDVCDKLKRIEGLAEIDAIRNTLEKLAEDLY